MIVCSIESIEKSHQKGEKEKPISRSDCLHSVIVYIYGFLLY